MYKEYEYNRWIHSLLNIILTNKASRYFIVLLKTVQLKKRFSVSDIKYSELLDFIKLILELIKDYSFSGKCGLTGGPGTAQKANWLKSSGPVPILM